ncbi:hypothetical protein F2Q68_00005464 [Brassica cretica]|uniref:Uncharacterized protein n=1 Tax=Brassica cretica TaxID=69181 RepID=A0A8S9JBT3_BRACR|nr:hypothetical protein F2Q68_00005464 [Brassica cretica]
MSRLHFAFVVLIRCNEGVTTNLLEAYPPCSSILERPLRATYQGRSQPERPARATSQSDQPERPAQVARVLTGRDTKKRVGSDLSERPTKSIHNASSELATQKLINRHFPPKRCNEGVTTNLLEAYPPCSSILEVGRSHPERPAQSDYLKSLQPERPAQVARVSLSERSTKVASSQSDQPNATISSRSSQSDQPERSAQVSRVLTGRDMKKRVGSDLLERLC